MRIAVFDIDGTLTDTNQVDEEYYIEALRHEVGVTLPGDWPALEEVTDSSLLRVACVREGRDYDPTVEPRIAGRLAELLQAAFEQTPERFRPIPGAADVFEVVRSAGWHIAIATGAWRPSALLKLRVADIPHDGVPLATSSECAARGDIIRLAASSAGHTGEGSLVYFGDGVWDGRAAKGIGCTFIGIGGPERVQLLAGAGAGVVLPDFTDTRRVLAALERAARGALGAEAS